MAGNILLAVGFFAAFVVIDNISDIGPTVWMPGAALFLTGLTVGAVSRFMPRKTLAGAQAAAQWRAFRTYLKSIDRFEQIEESQELFEWYLPYAIAFGLEKSWIETFARVPAPSPRWYGTLDWTAFSPGGGARSGSVRGAGGGSWTTPSLQGLSNQAAQSLQSSANSLFAWFNSADQTFSGITSGSGMGAGQSHSSGFSGSLTGLKLAGIAFKGLSGGGGGGFS
jgi:Predicted membrane protein (DUF2207)